MYLNKIINFTVVDSYINTVYFLAVSDVKKSTIVPSSAVPRIKLVDSN